MSMHLVECVRALDLPPSTKLALVAFADSADVGTRLAMPGFEAIQEWAGVSRAQTYDVMADLKARGLIRQETRGYRGRRATFTVFPDGCCDLHRVSVDEAPLDEPDALQAALEALAASGVELTDEQRQALAERVVPDGETGSGPLDPNDGDAVVSAGQEPTPEGRVQPTGPNDATYAQAGDRVLPAGPNQEEGSGKGPAQGGPLPSFEKHFPLTPSEAGGTAAGGEDNPGCRRHPAGDGRNCRACGTTSRQLAAAKREREAAARREREQAALAAAKRQRAAAAVPARQHRGTLAAARAQIAAAQLDRTTVQATEATGAGS